MKLNSKKKNISFFKLVFLLVLIYFVTSFVIDYFNLNNNLKNYFNSKIELEKENQELKKEIEIQKTKNYFSDYFFERMVQLEKRLKFQEDLEVKRKIFKLYFYDDFLYNSFVIKNRNYPFLKWKNVYFFGKFLFGKIVEVNDDFIKIRDFSDFGFKNNFVILEDDKVVFRGQGVGDSNGLIKIELPRKLELKKNAMLILDDEEKGIVAKFFKDNFQNQKTIREVYFKMLKNPVMALEVEI